MTDAAELGSWRLSNEEVGFGQRGIWTLGFLHEWAFLTFSGPPLFFESYSDQRFVLFIDLSRSIV